MRAMTAAWIGTLALIASGVAAQKPPDDLLDQWKNPPAGARPHTYWLWLNGYVDPATARAELQAMKDAGLGGVLLFDMGARGGKDAQPPAGPAFLSPAWLSQLKESVGDARRLGLQVDLSVVSSWDLGGHWIEPRHASMGLYPVETEIDGGRKVDFQLPFPTPEASAPLVNGKPAFWRDAAVLAIRNARRERFHEVVVALDPPGVHQLAYAVLDNGEPGKSVSTAPMSPVREFSIGVSETGSRDADFREVAHGTLHAGPGPQRFDLPAGTRGRYVRLRMLSAHDPAKPHWTLGEFEMFDFNGVNVAAARAADPRRNGASVIRGSAPLSYGPAWNRINLHDGQTEGPAAVFATLGTPPVQVGSAEEALDVTRFVDASGHLKWDAPPGRWTILRYVVMNTGERLKVPSPNSDGWATDHFSAEATRAHMDYVVQKLGETFGEAKASGISNFYLASYEVVGPVWSPGFIADFKRIRSYDMTPYLPALFGARVGTEEATERFLFDYRKTLSDVLITAYYQAAQGVSHKAGMGIKSEAGGPGPPVHNVPVDSLLANAAVDEIQGEFWPYWQSADGLWVVKETASAGHIYGKRRVHMESFTSFEGWREGPQDLKSSADRVFCEGGNHIVWHTWTHAPPEAGKPGWVYLAGTHLNRNVTWWPNAKPFIDYLSRASAMLQRGRFVADVLYYYGDGGYKFVGPRKVDSSLGPGYDYDYTNSDVILNRLSMRDGRFTLPDGTSYAVLVLPEDREIPVAVLEKIERLVSDGGTVVGPPPLRAPGLEGFPASDAKVKQLAARMWRGLDGEAKLNRSYGKGRVVWGMPLRTILESMKIGPDFTAPETLDFIHRQDGATDIYFVRNKSEQPVMAKPVFRATGREPELWDAVTGSTQTAEAWKTAGGGVEVPLRLAANGSVFVVFRKPGDAARVPVPPAPLPEPLSIGGRWQVSFEGLPDDLTVAGPGDWTSHRDQRVKYFAGSARYKTTFNVPEGWLKHGVPVSIDLGDLWTIGEVWLNGRNLGVAWTAPFTVDTGEGLRQGSNELVVEVTNTWFNRLVGDAKLPPAQRSTRTNVTTSGERPWAQLEPVRSGLFGPVRLFYRD